MGIVIAFRGNADRVNFRLDNIEKIVLWNQFTESSSLNMRDALLELESMNEDEFEDIRDAGWEFRCSKTNEVIESFEELVRVIVK
jgi:hypothetical protein